MPSATPIIPGTKFQIEKLIFEGMELYRVFFDGVEICVGPNFEQIEWLIGSAAQFHGVEVELCEFSPSLSEQSVSPPSL